MHYLIHIILVSVHGTSERIRDAAMRLITTRTVLLDLLEGILCPKTLTICIDESPRPVLELSDELNRDRCEGSRHVLAERVKLVIAMLAKIPLDDSPEVLDEVDFTMILRKEDTEVAYQVVRPR